MAIRTIPGLVMLGLLGLVSQARGDDRPAPDGGVPCPDAWCGDPPAWPTVDSGSGPETGPTTIFALGVASETLGSGVAARAETAAVFHLDFRFPLALRLDGSAVERSAMRLVVDVQELGWRVGPALAAARTTEAMATADRGGRIALGYTRTLLWLSRASKLAATVDAEGATGLGVRGGLGLRTTDVSPRAVGAAGLALGLQSRIGGLRAHARMVHALTADPLWTNAVEVGAGVATRFDWPRFHGPLPVEVWADVRGRRATEGTAGERALAAGIDYLPRDGFSRIGLVGVANHERLGDGTTGVERVLLVRFDRPFGDR